ncbi:hypothetical protein [Bremerella cremea]|uniref:hypothetical protein n=1 Tax=Bremerella cremea TaxID=1031537 RepID=UPI0031EA9465
MSIAVLGQVYDEVRRLSIAGSSVASGDFRLQKLIAPLEKSGEKAPVFKKVAEAVTRLVESTEKSSAEALLDLSTLVNAILYTQGQTGLEGELAPVTQVGTGILPKRTPSSILKTLNIALTQAGSGRLEVIQESLRREPFPDPRLLESAIDALDGTYHEVSDLVEEKILPQYGMAIIPLLREKYDLKGKAADARRLSVLHRVDPEGTKPLIHEALEDGSKEVKIEAISKLREPTDLPFLIEQSKAKAAAVRDAAFTALAEIESPEAAEVIVQGLTGKASLNHVRGGLTSRHPHVLETIISEIRKSSNKITTASPADRKSKPHVNECERLCGLIDALAERTDPQTESLLLELFGHRDQITKAESKDTVYRSEPKILQRMNECTDKTRELLIQEHESLDETGLKLAVMAAMQVDNPKRFYDLFHGYIENGKSASTKKRDARNKADLIATTIRNHVEYGHRYWHTDRTSEHQVAARRDAIDPRWLDLAIKHDEMVLLIPLARPGHKKSHDRLAAEMKKMLKAAKRPDYQIGDVLSAVLRSDHPQKVDLVIETIHAMVKWGHAYYFYMISDLIPRLPKSEAPRFEALLAELPDVMADRLIQSIAELKNKSEAS